MFKEIKETNEKIIREHFSEVLGKEYEIQCNWGFPVTILEIDSSNEDRRNAWKVAINLLTKKYEIQSFSTKKDENGNDVPDWSSLNNEIIEFIVERTSAISIQFFTTRPVSEEEKAELEKQKESNTEKEA